VSTPTPVWVFNQEMLEAALVSWRASLLADPTVPPAFVDIAVESVTRFLQSREAEAHKLVQRTGPST
jgi:hypothetical protein